MARFLKKYVSDGPILAVIMISLTAVITHGLAIPTLGYYHDDWYMLWSGVSRGSQSLIPLFSIDRPFMGVIYSVFYRLIGQNIFGWHLFALVFRIAGAVAFYWILNLVWPKLKGLSVLSAMVFVVFPGFLAEPNAATKINHLLGYGAALFSIALTLYAAKTDHKVSKYLSFGLSILLMALYLWIYEYMIGLEVMRILLLFWVLWQGDRAKTIAVVKRVFLTYIPYVAVTGLFLFWRVFIFESTRSATDLKGLVSEYSADFGSMALRLVFQVIKDFLSASVFAWAVQPYQLFAKADADGILSAIFLALVVALLAVGYVLLVRKTDREDQEHVSPYVLVLIGAVATLAAVFPVVLSNRHLDLMDQYKAYALHPSAAVMIMVTSLVAMMKPRFREVALIALLGLSVTTQSMNNQRWADYWDIQRGFWWQLNWRAPELEENTLVMAYLPEGFVFQQDYEIWGPVNLIYRPEKLSVPHIQSEVLNPGTVMDVLEGRVTDPYVRDIFVQRDFRNLLLVSQPTTASCIHVIDGDMPVYSSSERYIVEKVGAFSDVSQIMTTTPEGPRVPPAAIFGREPEHGWCYYYQQASLARQQGDWQKIGALYDTVVSKDLRPVDRSEYFVFIEGLVNLGRVDEAKAAADSGIRENDALRYSICKSLSSAPVFPDAFNYQRDEINKIICDKPVE